MAPSTSSTSLMSVVAVLLLLFPVTPVLSPSAQGIFAACKKRPVLPRCPQLLGSDVGGLDYQVFGGLVVGLLADNATSTKTKIDSLLRGGGDSLKPKAEDNGAVSRCLRSCQLLYGGILDGGPACTAAVKAKKFGDATAILEKAAAAAKECEDGFGKSNVMSLLTAEDGNAFELAKLGVGLLRFA
uniref:Uncharacterized protein n=1 Tax=Avena sativa TaxID=4498 RepID=A0ACD5X371_AVESA